jgi:bifunctional non-homologous end joining protein LigD
MPITWSQAKKGLDASKYAVRTVPTLIAKSTAWEDYCDGERPLAAAIKRLGNNINKRLANLLDLDGRT